MRKVLTVALLLVASAVLGQTEGKSPFVKLGSPKADSTWENIVVNDSLRNEGPLRQKGIATFGATATPAVIGADGSVTGLKISSSLNGVNGGLWTANGLAKLQELGGNGYMRLTASNGDTMSIWADGNSSRINSTDQLVISVSGSYYVFRNTDIYGTNDVTDLGTSSVKFQTFYCSDNIYLGGKGQTATLTVSRENTIAGSDSSAQVKVQNGIGGVFKLANETGDSLRFVGVQGPTYVAARGDIWLSRNGGTTPRDTLWAKVHADSSAYVVFTARAKAH